MRGRIRTALLLMLDLAMVAMEWPVLEDLWRDSGVWMLRFYTNASNVLAMLASTVCLCCGVYCLVKNRPSPRWAQLLRYIAACCLMVTFIVAAFVLVPMEPQNTLRSFMLEGKLLYTHTLCPLVMLLSAAVCGGRKLGARHAALAIVPTVIYGAISIVMVARRVYQAPYPFLQVRHQPVWATVIWCIAIVAGNFIVSWLVGRMARGEKTV